MEDCPGAKRKAVGPTGPAHRHSGSRAQVLLADGTAGLAKRTAGAARGTVHQVGCGTTAAMPCVHWDTPGTARRSSVSATMGILHTRSQIRDSVHSHRPVALGQGLHGMWRGQEGMDAGAAGFAALDCSVFASRRGALGPLETPLLAGRFLRQRYSEILCSKAGRAYAKDTVCRLGLGLVAS